jgi:hypothetical protein
MDQLKGDFAADDQDIKSWSLASITGGKFIRAAGDWTQKLPLHYGGDLVRFVEFKRVKTFPNCVIKAVSFLQYTGGSLALMMHFDNESDDETTKTILKELLDFFDVHDILYDHREVALLGCLKLSNARMAKNISTFLITNNDFCWD